MEARKGVNRRTDNTIANIFFFTKIQTMVDKILHRN
jgi:hypothetical protein